MERQSGWHKASFSASGNCVEVLVRSEGVRVRNTRDRSGPELSFTAAEWRAFVQGVRAGEFDPPEGEVA